MKFLSLIYFILMQESNIEQENNLCKLYTYKVITFGIILILIFNICFGINTISLGKYQTFNDICIVKFISNNTIICNYKNCTYESAFDQPISIGQKLQGIIKCNNKSGYYSAIILLSISIFLLINCIIIQVFLFTSN